MASVKALWHCITGVYVWGVCAQGDRSTDGFRCTCICVCTHRHPYFDGEFLSGFQGVSPQNTIECHWGLSGNLPEDCFAIIPYLCLYLGELLQLCLDQSKDHKTKLIYSLQTASNLLGRLYLDSQVCTGYSSVTCMNWYDCITSECCQTWRLREPCTFLKHILHKQIKSIMEIQNDGPPK